MGVETEVTKKEDYIYFKIKGDYSWKNERPKFDEIVKASDNLNCETILLDCREINYDVSTFDRYEIGEYIAENYGERNLKIALLGNPKKLDRFTETVAQNRGANFRMFTEENEALKWLLNKKS